MTTFIKLTIKQTGAEVWFNTNHIEAVFKWIDGSVIVTTNCDVTIEEKYIVNESPEEIMAKIREVQNG